MFEVKNSINWETCKSYFTKGGYDIYYDSDNYSKLLAFVIQEENIVCYLDELFGGNWECIEDINFKMLETHYEALNRINPTDDVNVWTNKTLNDFVEQGKIDNGGLTGILNRHFKSLPDVKLQYDPDEVKFTKPDKVNNPFSNDLKDFLTSFEHLLNVKNKAYGNSALQPINTFSKASSSDVILQQIDHKLSRIKNSDTPLKNDVIDLMGYLTLYCLDQDWLDLSDLHN